MRQSETVAERATDEANGDPDAELVYLAGQGDASACAGLVDRHINRIVGVAERLLGSRADAEDVAQEVFLRVWRHAAAWRPGEARFSTWLYRVATNLCTDRLRRRRETGLEVVADFDDGSVPADHLLVRQDIAKRVQAALAMLPERQRTAVVLCHYEELGNIEAAKVMDVSVEAMESLLSRGRRRLREMLRGERADLYDGEQ